MTHENPAHTFSRNMMPVYMLGFAILLGYAFFHYFFYDQYGSNLLVLLLLAFFPYTVIFISFKYERVLLYSDRFVHKKLIGGKEIPYVAIGLFDKNKVTSIRNVYEPMNWFIYDTNNQYIHHLNASFFKEGNRDIVFQSILPHNPELKVTGKPELF